jgi:hypothetical protein
MGNNGHADNGKDISFELYKLEYEKAAERYDNIYQSAWTIFSYITVAAGGVLAFGGKWFSPGLLVIFILVPLIFWYMAVFGPANKYGDQVIDRLSEIETALNAKYSTSLDHYSKFKRAREEDEALSGAPEQLRTLQTFLEGQRVRTVVRMFLLIIAIAVLLSLLTKKIEFRVGGNGDETKVTLAPQPLQLQISGLTTSGLPQANITVEQQLNGLAQSIKEMSDDIKELKTKK